MSSFTTIVTVLMLSVPYSTTAYGTKASTATLTIPVGAATPGNPSYDPVSLTVKKGDYLVFNKTAASNAPNELI